MLGDARFANACRIRARGMKKGAAGASRTIDGFFVEQKEIVGVVVVLLADHIHQAGPAVTNADDLIAFAQSAQSNGADGGVEAGTSPPPVRMPMTPFLVLTFAMCR